MLEIRQYHSESAEEWNMFVAHSKNGTFLIDRNYMDYHAHRFSDFSLMIYTEKGALLALLPAHREGNCLFSHGGLTYGGLVMSDDMTAQKAKLVLEALNAFLADNGISRVRYKPIPHIYHRRPAEEDLYAIVQCSHARLLFREIASVVPLGGNMPKWSQLRVRGVKKADKQGVQVMQSDDYAGFWYILSDNLLQKYGKVPVHTLEEIRLLASRFPCNIRLFVAKQGSEMLAGTVIYETEDRVAHSQYISASPRGKQTGALDKLFHCLLTEVYAHMRYFDFGISTEQHGEWLNENLIHQKEGFGARAVCYDTYEWTL
ncbi:MAG: GNAT family N-acetyltransferase [Prevotella sp.]